MSIHAGNIIHVGANNVIDRLQSAGLGDVRVPTEVIREVGNRQVVDKIPGDPDFTFTLETFDVSTELEAWLTGHQGAGMASGQQAGANDPPGTAYSWLDAQHVNITSPWKDPKSGASGVVEAGHIVPGYFPTRIRYRFGVSDQATQEVELGGGAFYYAEGAPVEQFETGDGAAKDFATDDQAIGYRQGGVQGTAFQRVFGVLVDGVPSVRDVDYTEIGSPADASSHTGTVRFTTAPAAGADIRFVYFTKAEKAFPQAVHASTVTKPAALRGRNICVLINSKKLGGVQAFELEATVEGELEREFCNEESIGRTVSGTDTNGSVTVRAKDRDAFFALLTEVTGLPRGEVVGWLNQNDVELEVQLRNPKNPAQTLKTLFVEDATFSIPGTQARVNQPTDFELRWESRNGTYDAVKGARS